MDEENKKFTLAGKTFHEGDVISIDGSTGNIYGEAIPTVDAVIAGEFGRIMGWADKYRRLRVRTNADTPADAKKARELGCNKLALGHHFRDVVETTVMGMFYGSQLQAMPPKLRSRNFPGMELIRPMYCIHEDDIIAWQRYNGLQFIQCACRFTERAAAHGSDGSSSKRQEVKLLLRELRRKNPDIEKSIFHSIHSVCLDTMVGYKSGGVEHTFADCYRERGEMAKEDAE